MISIQGVVMLDENMQRTSENEMKGITGIQMTRTQREKKKESMHDKSSIKRVGLPVSIQHRLIPVLDPGLDHPFGA